MNKRINKLVLLIVEILYPEYPDKNFKNLLQSYHIDWLYGSVAHSRTRLFLSQAVLKKYFLGFVESQYLIDVSLKIISIKLYNLFNKDQKNLRKDFEKMLGVDAKDGCASREYLKHDLQKRRKEINSEIEFLKEKFNEIISSAEDLHFPVFDDDQYRYDWYRVLSLSRSEIRAYFNREGIPNDFLEQNTEETKLG